MLVPASATVDETVVDEFELPNITAQEVIALPMRLTSDWFCKWEQSGKLVPKFDISVIRGYEYQ